MPDRTLAGGTGTDAEPNDPPAHIAGPYWPDRAAGADWASCQLLIREVLMTGPAELVLGDLVVRLEPTPDPADDVLPTEWAQEHVYGQPL